LTDNREVWELRSGLCGGTGGVVCRIAIVAPCQGRSGRGGRARRANGDGCLDVLRAGAGALHITRLGRFAICTYGDSDPLDLRGRDGTPGAGRNLGRGLLLVGKRRNRDSLVLVFRAGNGVAISLASGLCKGKVCQRQECEDGGLHDR
jgi:hypothetical protein